MGAEAPPLGLRLGESLQQRRLALVRGLQHGASLLVQLRLQPSGELRRAWLGLGLGAAVRVRVRVGVRVGVGVGDLGTWGLGDLGLGLGLGFEELRRASLRREALRSARALCPPQLGDTLGLGEGCLQLPLPRHALVLVPSHLP